jgi:SAM-dependent methyltransferase
MSRHYRDKVYANSGNPPLLELLPPGTRTVLDVGCGAGDNARLLTERGVRVWGVTLSEAEARLAAPWCESVRVADVERDALDVPQCDAILLSHVVEHFVDPTATLNRLARKLRPGGAALVAVPNMAFWRVRARLAAGDWRRDADGPLDRTHLQFWSWDTAPSMFDGTPFRLDVRSAGQLALPLWPLRAVLPRVAGVLDRRFGAVWPNGAALQVLLRATLLES